MADPSITRSTRTYILAALLATLAATALVAISFVVLCPAQVTFVVTHASRNDTTNDSTVSLHLSIFANSSQRHTKVKLESVFIVIFNSSDSSRIWEDDWQRRLNAHVDEMVPGGYLEYPGTTNISVSAAAPSGTFPEFAPDWRIDDAGLTVTVMAQVHFKVGAVRTRLYGIKVYCDGVVFPDQNNKNTSSRSTKFPVTCHS